MIKLGQRNKLENKTGTKRIWHRRMETWQIIREDRLAMQTVCGSCNIKLGWMKDKMLKPTRIKSFQRTRRAKTLKPKLRHKEQIRFK